VGAVAPFDHSNKEDRDLELLERSYSRLSLWRKKRSVFAFKNSKTMDLSPDFTHSGWKNRRIFTPPPVFGCGHLHSSWALKMQAGNDRHRTRLGLG